MATSAADKLAVRLSHISGPKDIAAFGGVAGVANAIAGVLGSGADAGVPSGAALLSRGLSPAAAAASSRLFGANSLPTKPVKPFWEHFKEAFEDRTLQILVLSAAVSCFFAVYQKETDEILQAIMMIAVIALVSGINSFQNWSKAAEFKALAALKEDFRVSLVRGGAAVEATASSVAVGDLVTFAPGDKLPADGLLVRGFDVRVDQASMTGESVGVRKDEEGDALMIGGCLVQQGDGTFLVTAVGGASKMGQTVMLVEDAEPEDTPLQQRLAELADQIGYGGMAVGALTFVVLACLWAMSAEPRNWAAVVTYEPLVKYFIVSITIVVVAVPEGLPLAVTVSLYWFMRQMMKDKNLVRQMHACETMGSATVIASDKTGTLTENRMRVGQAWLFGRSLPEAQLHALSGSIDPGAQHRLSKAIALNSTAGLNMSPLEAANDSVTLIGNPTEAALLYMMWRGATARGFDYGAEREAAKPLLLARRPFDKATKFMATLYRAEADGCESPVRSERGGAAARASAASAAAVLYVKGAPEYVLGMCTQLATEDGEAVPISAERRGYLGNVVHSMASRGLRTLAVAYRRLPAAALAAASGGALKGHEDLSDAGARAAYASLLADDGDAAAAAAPRLESELVLLGIFGISDPLREGVTESLAQCVRAGIRVMMITGDHKETASHIARECGILQPGFLVLEGSEFRRMDEAGKRAAAARLAVLARSSPADKHELVRVLREAGEVVAVTGDGTNDAPALRLADVGLAMGSGTEVAKEASDIIILDDRFSSIVASVRWGRSIKANIRKFLTFQLTINIVALLLTFVTACSNGGDTSRFPLKPMQLLWVNVIMDTAAALALATEPPSAHLLDYPPQGKDEPLITAVMYKNMLGHAGFQSALLLWLTMTQAGADFFGIAARGGLEHCTAVFTTFVILQIFNLFNCRATHDEWNVLEGFMDSSVGASILAGIVVVQVMIVQLGGAAWQTVPLSPLQWALCVGLGVLSLPVGAALKLVRLEDDHDNRASVASQQVAAMRRATLRFDAHEGSAGAHAATPAAAVAAAAGDAPAAAAAADAAPAPLVRQRSLRLATSEDLNSLVAHTPATRRTTAAAAAARETQPPSLVAAAEDAEDDGGAAAFAATGPSPSSRRRRAE